MATNGQTRRRDFTRPELKRRGSVFSKPGVVLTGILALASGVGALVVVATQQVA